MNKRLSKWAWWWITLTLAFIISDAIASKPPHKKPRSWSEYFKRLLPWGWKRVLAIGVLTLILIHLASPDLNNIPRKEVDDFHSCR